MEILMGGLLIGMIGMLVMLIVAVWKETASHQAETHPTHRES